MDMVIGFEISILAMGVWGGKRDFLMQRRWNDGFYWLSLEANLYIAGCGFVRMFDAQSLDVCSVKFQLSKSWKNFISEHRFIFTQAKNQAQAAGTHNELRFLAPPQSAKKTVLSPLEKLSDFMLLVILHSLFPSAKNYVFIGGLTVRMTSTSLLELVMLPLKRT